MKDRGELGHIMKKRRILSGILAITMVFASRFVSYASETGLKLELGAVSNTLQLSGLEEAIVGVEITLNVTKGSFENVEFIPENTEYESILKENDKETITLYLISSTVLNEESDSATLGVFRHSGEVEFEVSSVKMVNFLQLSSVYENITVIIHPEEGELEENLPEEDEKEEDTEEKDENSSGGNFPSSSGNSGSNSSDSGTEEEFLEEEIQVDEDTLARYQEILAQYSDIQGHWAENFILYVVDYGYFKGISETEFAPNSSMTRAMFVTVMRSIDGGTKTMDISYFTDMVMEDWFYPYVSWGVANGLTTGTSDTTFSPDKGVTREEMAVMVFNYIKNKGFDLEKTAGDSAFEDNNDISLWAVEAVETVRQWGIMSGKMGNYFDPKGMATRGEVATIIMNLCEKIY